MTQPQTRDDVERVREATDLAELIGEHVALRPQGRELVGLCPFHDDRTPSFHVVTHKGSGFYKCFACGAAGDCFRFVTEYHKVDFPEALRMLAERAGIELAPRDGRPSDGPTRSDLFKANAFARDFYRDFLASDAGTACRTRFDERGIDEAMRERFQLGASPDSFDALLSRLNGRAASIRIAEDAGLVKPRRQGGGHYDAFRNRLMFPIHDEAGRVVAFGARAIAADDQPKYLNSPESPLFRKSRTLYGFSFARDAIARAKRALVVEGYTDVIACHRAGFEHAVGTLGTALTEEHARLLSRHADEVVLVFDGDEAGVRAADRAVRAFLTAPVDVRICVLPGGADPDDLLGREDGPALFAAAIEHAVDALEFKLARFARDLADAGGLAARQKRAEAFLEDLRQLGLGELEGVKRGLVSGRLSELLGLSVAEVDAIVSRRTGRRAAARPASEHGPGVDAGAPPVAPTIEELAAAAGVSRARRLAEVEATGLLLLAADAAAADPPEPGLFAIEPLRRIVERIAPIVAAGEPVEVNVAFSVAPPELVASILADVGRDRDVRRGAGVHDDEQWRTAVAALRRVAGLERLDADLATGGDAMQAIERLRHEHRPGAVRAAAIGRPGRS